MTILNNKYCHKYNDSVFLFLICPIGLPNPSLKSKIHNANKKFLRLKTKTIKNKTISSLFSSFNQL